MIKRSFCLILTAVFLSALCIPCAAEDTRILKQRGYHAFSDIPSTESPYFNAVSTCYEFGWMDGIREDTFGVQEPLTKAEMVTLLARLYSVRNGGDGTIPPLPEDLGNYIRFYDSNGALVHNLFSAYCLDFYAYESHGLTAVFYEENLSQEQLTIQVGFPEDRTVCTAEGVRLGYDPKDNCTRYRFTFPDEIDARELELVQYQKDAMYWRSTWEINQREGIDDPTPYDAILYLLYRKPANLPYCFRTMSLDSMPYETVWRMELAVPLAALCQDLPEIREIDTLPDLPDWRFGQEETEAVLSLYRRGIFKGFDEAGTFAGPEWLTRGQAALVTARALNLMQA